MGGARGAQNWNPAGDGVGREDLDFGRFWRLMGWRMVGPCWTHVGVSWVDSGPLASLGSTWGPGRRLMGRDEVRIDVFWAYVELMLGVAGLNLAGWAVF